MDSILSVGSLATIRRDRGWSQEALASRSGVSRAEVSAIETGRVVPSVTVALRLAAALGSRVEDLFVPASGAAPVPWAWAPDDDHDGRVWRASVHGRTLAYPTELTAAGPATAPAARRHTGHHARHRRL